MANIASTWGILAEFDSPGALLRAARETRKAGYPGFDVHTPYPVHGMDLAMGLGRSPLGWIVTGGALAGAATALGLQYYVGWDYPLIHQGKPALAWQPFIVVLFELTVLFASFAAVFGMLAVNGLPQWYHPTLKSNAFAKATDNGFFLSIPTDDVSKAKEFAMQLGAVRIEELEQ